MKILVPTTLEMLLTLPEGVQIVEHDVTQQVPAVHLDAEALVMWGHSSAWLAEQLPRLTRLRLVQSLSAGNDHLIPHIPVGVTACSGVGLHDATVAEHTLALLLSLVRRLPECAREQARRVWSRELGGMQLLHPEGPITTLLGSRVVVWGFGSIAQTLAPMLAALGAKVTGVARSAGERGGFPVVAAEDMSALLPQTDVLICILPSTPQTESALNADVFAALNSDAFVVNVGRGATVDESALMNSLRNGEIAGAAIDVADTEPLPADNPLWETPGLLITPHAAGGRPVNPEALVESNVLALLDNRPLRNRLA